MHVLRSISHLFLPQRSNNHRPKLLHVENIISLTAVVVGFSLFMAVSNKINPSVGYILGYASNISTTDVISQTNEQRATAGLPALEHNGKLSAAAAAKAQDMFSQQYWSHQAPDGKEPWAFISASGYSYVAAGENLARDFMNTNDMVSAWMASPTHKANIMNPRYQEIGVAVVNGTLQGMETTLVVQMFGRPTASNVVAQVTPTAAASEPTPTPVSLNLSSPAPESTTTPLPNPQVATKQSEELTLPETDTQPVITNAPVLAQTLVSSGEVSRQLGLFSPLELVKAFSLGLLLLLVGTLLYDWYIAHNQGTVRLVGKNMAHILYLAAIAVVILLFKGGFVS